MQTRHLRLLAVTSLRRKEKDVNIPVQTLGTWQNLHTPQLKRKTEITSNLV